MFNSLTGRTLTADDPPDGPRHHRARRRLGAILTAVSALALGVAVMAAPQPAQAVSMLDGHWTVSHGGTGHLSLNPDGTYTSTCKAYPNYPDAFCPAPSGTFLTAPGYVDFHGDDGSTTSYRFGGDTADFDSFIIKSVFGSRTNSPLAMTKGDYFSCTEWELPVRLGPTNPLVEYDAVTGHFYLTGSHQLVTSSSVVETAPNYFQSGVACPPTPPEFIIGIDSIHSISTPANFPGYWIPETTITIKDKTGAPVSGATVNGIFLSAGSVGEPCVTAADGTCTIGGDEAIPDSIANSQFSAYNITKLGLTWDKRVVTIMVYDPNTPPAPHSVSRVDSARDASVPAAVSGQWVPKATVTIKDLEGTAVSGATVTGKLGLGLDGSCITVADGTCTMGDTPVSDAVTSTQFYTTSITKDGMTWDGLSDTLTIYDPNTATPPPTPVPVTHHVGDLDNATAPASSLRKWQPKVVATVLDSSGTVVTGATVSGTFTNHKGTLTCTTAANGTCTLGNFSLSRSTNTTAFTVTGVVKASSTYAPKANSDPDGDSNGTTITIKRP